MTDGKLKLALLNLLMCKMTDKLSSQKGFHLEIVIVSIYMFEFLQQRSNYAKSPSQ